MGMDELLKSIEKIESETKNQYYELGKKLFEEKPDSAASFFPEITGKIQANKDRISDIKKQINIIKGIVICEHCGAEVKNTYTFCQECGNKMKVAVAAAPDGFVLCVNCNTANEEGSKYCKCCGTRLNKTVEMHSAKTENKTDNALPTVTKPAVETPVTVKPHIEVNNPTASQTKAESDSEEAGGRKCPQCGGPLDENDTFCISCGAVFVVPEMDEDDFDIPDVAEVKVEEAPLTPDDTKECPKCGEKMEKHDTVCRRCGCKLLM